VKTQTITDAESQYRQKPLLKSVKSVYHLSEAVAKTLEAIEAEKGSGGLAGQH